LDLEASVSLIKGTAVSFEVEGHSGAAATGLSGKETINIDR
jgi:hypothetical protein